MSRTSQDLAVDNQDITSLVGELSQLDDIATRYRLTHESQKVQDRLRDVRLPLMVVISGEGNFGKSSLVNHLSGREIAKVDFLPKTWKTDVYWQSESSDEYALIRYRGREQHVKISIDEALRVSDLEEKRFADDETHNPEIVEIIWRYKDLMLGHQVCLVDTPGLGRFDAKLKRRLTESGHTILGAVFTVDEVCEYYFHRADVVLFAVAADQLEKKNGHDVLKNMLEIQRKPVLPVITKVDRCPKGQRAKLIEVFRDKYGDIGNGLLRESRPALVVCGGQSPEVGLNILPLRNFLANQIASGARERKLRASRQFIVDNAAYIGRITDESARTLVGNLRTISDTGDQMALELMQLRKKGRDDTERGLRDHIRRKWDGLQRFCEERAKQIIMQHETEQQVNEKLGNWLQIDEIARRVQNGIQQAFQNLPSLAAATCRTRPLGHLQISLGEMTRSEDFSLNFRFSPPAVKPPTTAMTVEHLPDFGFLDGGLLKVLVNSWEKLRRATGCEPVLQPKELDWCRECAGAISSRLDRMPHELAGPSFKSYQTEHLAGALQAAVKDAFRDYAHCTTSDLLSMLRAVDADLHTLSELAGNSDPNPTHFASWAEYWVSGNVEVGLVRKLVADVIVPDIGDLRKHLSQFRAKEVEGWEQLFDEAYRNQADVTITAGPEYDRPQVLQAIANVLCLNMRHGGLLQSEMNLGCLIEGAAEADWLGPIADRMSVHARQDSSIGGIDRELATRLPDTNVTGLADTYSVTVRKAFAERLRNLLRDTGSKAQVDALASAKIAISPGSTLLPVFLVSMSPVLGVVAGGAMHSLVYAAAATLLAATSGALLILAGKARLLDDLRQVTKTQVRTDIEAAIATVATATANGVNEAFVGRVVTALEMKLNPRPLQRALNGEEN